MVKKLRKYHHHENVSVNITKKNINIDFDQEINEETNIEKKIMLNTFKIIGNHAVIKLLPKIMKTHEIMSGRPSVNVFWVATVHRCSMEYSEIFPKIYRSATAMPLHKN